MKKGFTLIELIVVIIIIGILASVAVPMMQNITERTKRTEAIAALGTIRTAERIVKMEFGFYVDFGDQVLPEDTILGKYLKNSDLSGKYYTMYVYRVERNKDRILAMGQDGIFTIMKLSTGEISYTDEP
ncbi:MAG: prepilin-type N-terminal cleavage/methylation domain-containing protein [Candidatus Omnitrophota bacterium]|nr:prepilin-type N-terminal cleavage/methylation domain-containing protein [Candidatus Omnitrophota bacterium]